MGNDGQIRASGNTTYQNLRDLHSRAQSARGRLDPRERLKAEAQRRILDYLGINSRQFATAAETVSLTRTAFTGSPAALVQIFWQMLDSGLSALWSDSEMYADVCAAHTFSYWMFRYSGAPSPQRMPDFLLQRHRGQDMNGTNSGVTVATHFGRWNQCFNDTMAALDARTPIAVVRNQVTQRFGSADTRGWTNDRFMDYYRILWSEQFGYDPRLAASTFFLARIRDKNPTTYKPSAMSLFRAMPYPPNA